jgi:predicted RND superfamily exporter protein
MEGARLLGSLLDRITGLLWRRPKAVLVVALVIVAIFGALATRLRLDPDVLNLVPRHNREVNEFRDLIKDTGTLDFHVVVIEFPKGAEPSNYFPLIDAIGGRLRQSSL